MKFCCIWYTAEESGFEGIEAMLRVFDSRLRSNARSISLLIGVPNATAHSVLLVVAVTLYIAIWCSNNP